MHSIGWSIGRQLTVVGNYVTIDIFNVHIVATFFTSRLDAYTVNCARWNGTIIVHSANQMVFMQLTLIENHPSTYRTLTRETSILFTISSSITSSAFQSSQVLPCSVAPGTVAATSWRENYNISWYLQFRFQTQFSNHYFCLSCYVDKL